MATPNEVTLANLGGGALMECATLELRKICDNIADPNIKTDAKRKLQINIVIKPDPKGQMAQITYEVKASMPGPDAGRTAAYIAFAPETKAISLFEVEAHPPLFEAEKPLAPIEPLAAKRA
jgi:hypothetical protein